MRITVLAVGRLRSDPLLAVAEDYKQRIARYAKLREIELPNGAEMRRKLPPYDVLVALEVGGLQLSSEAFSNRLERYAQHGKGEICFLIGGADGLDATLSAEATQKLSLSTLTLPHRLARVLLYEQLYRAFTIQNGEPYAREG